MPTPGTWDDPKKKQTDDPGAIPQSGTNNPAIVITNVSGGTPSGGSATVTWTTSQKASDRVEYGINPNRTQNTTVEANKGSAGVTSHSVTLTGLTVGALYLFRVHSRLSGGKDGMGNAVQDGYDFHVDGQFVGA